MNNSMKMRACAATLVLMAFGSSAIAGSFAEGCGETIQEAMDAALNTAERAVKSRGKGCIAPYEGEIFHGLDKKNIGGTTVWCAKAHYAHHAGSCGQYSRDQDWLMKQAEKLNF